MIWAPMNSKYLSGENLLFGKYVVGGIFYDASRSRDDSKKYRAFSKLPGIKEGLGHFTTAEEAKKMVELAANHWIDNAGLQKGQS